MNSMNNRDDVLSFADAAAECGQTVAHFMGTLVFTGMLFEVSTDPRCWQYCPGAFRWHADDCECRFIAGPHPDMVELAADEEDEDQRWAPCDLDPVDSVTRACCGGIGGHTPDCDR